MRSIRPWKTLLFKWRLSMVLRHARPLSTTNATSSSRSVNEQELEKFHEADWWNTEGRFGELHRMNSVRSQLIRSATLSHFEPSESLRFPLQNRSILDVGCGGGIFSEALGRLGGNVTGIDVIPRNIEIAQSHLNLDPDLRSLVRYECISAEDLAEQGRRFDWVVASEVIEHVQQPVAFMETLSQLMEPNGLLCVTTLNRTLPSLFAAIWMAEYVLKLLPQGTHDWRVFLTPSELTLAAKRFGLKLDTLVGFQRNPLTRQWRIANDTSINYGAIFRRESSTEGTIQTSN